MGLSASQARLLSITRRLNNNELQSEFITNSKIQLANKNVKATDKYINALNSTKIEYISYDKTGIQDKVTLTFNTLNSYSPLKNQYNIYNADGQVIVSEQDAENFRNTKNLKNFLDKYNIIIWENEQPLPYYDINDPIYQEQLKTYNDYQEAVAEGSLYSQFSAIVGTSDNPTDEDSCYKHALDGTTNCYRHIISHLVDYDSERDKRISEKDYTTSTGDSHKILNNEGNLGKKPEFNTISSALNMTYSNGEPIFLCDGDDQYDGAEDDVKENKLEEVYNNYNKIFADEFQAQETFNTAKSKYEALLASQEATEEEITAAQTLLNDAQSALTTEQQNNTEEKALITKERDRWILLSDYKLTEDGTYELKSLKQKAIDIDYALEKELLTEAAEIKAVLINFTEGDMQMLQEIDPPKVPQYKIADSTKAQWYINLWYAMNGNDSPQMLTPVHDEKTNVIDYKLENELKSETKGEGKNHYKALSQKEAKLASNPDWIQHALTNGIITMKQASLNIQGYIKWSGVEFTSTADIREVQDDTKIAKAEAEYNKAIREIQCEDKKYDQELRKLDTEHSAMQQEVDSLKNVISKNVERSFAAFS